MKNYKPSSNFLLSVGSLFLTFFIAQGIIVPSLIQESLQENKDVDSNIISTPAREKDDLSCDTIDPEEYVCNGDFETGPSASPVWLGCDSFETAEVPHWCQYWGSPDRITPPSSPVNPLGSGNYVMRNVWIGPNGGYDGNKEAMTSKLKTPLTQGHEYRLSFDYRPRPAEHVSPVFGLNTEAILGDPNILPAEMILPTPEQIIYDGVVDNPGSQWYHFEQDFTASGPYEYLVVWGEHSGATVGNNNFHYFDNISIRSIDSSVDIMIKKTLIDSTLSLFDRLITWRIIVQNLGPIDATNILVKELIPSGLIYYSHSTPNPNVYDNSAHMLNIPQLPAGGQTYIDITMKVPNSKKVCGPKTNIAVLHHVDQDDTNLQNNQDQAVINLPKCPITEAPQTKTR